jgi:hypothetical protein
MEHPAFRLAARPIPPSKGVVQLGEILRQHRDSTACPFPASAAHVTRSTMRFSLDAEPRNGPGRNRTCDLGIKSPLLYQLSYRPAGLLERF